MSDYGQERHELAEEVARLGAYVEKVEAYVATALHGFVGDPPDSDFQSGYLAALKAVATEAMGYTLDRAIARIDEPFMRPVLRIVTGDGPPWQ